MNFGCQIRLLLFIYYRFIGDIYYNQSVTIRCNKFTKSFSDLHLDGRNIYWETIIVILIYLYTFSHLIFIVTWWHRDYYPTFELNVWDFPVGAVIKNPPANAGDTGLSPGPGRSHMPRHN